MDSRPASLQLPPGAWRRHGAGLPVRAATGGGCALQWQGSYGTRASRGRRWAMVDAGNAVSGRESKCITTCQKFPMNCAIPFHEAVLHADADLLVADKPAFPARSHRAVRALSIARPLLGRLITPHRKLTRSCHCTGSIATPPAWCCFRSTRKAGRATRPFFASDGSKKVMRRLRRRCQMLSFPCIRSSRVAAGEPFFRVQEVARTGEQRNPRRRHRARRSVRGVMR